MVKKRKETPLSLYYLSVTGLLGSCYGYSNSRLSVLLTIAHKGSIQLWATMQITLSHFLSVAFSLHFILFTSVYISNFIYTHLSLWVSALSLSETSHKATVSQQFHHPTVCCFYPSSYPSLCFTLPSRPVPPSPQVSKYPTPDCEMLFFLAESWSNCIM